MLAKRLLGIQAQTVQRSERGGLKSKALAIADIDSFWTRSLYEDGKR